MAKFVDNENYDSILEEAKSAKPVKRLRILKRVLIAVSIVSVLIIVLFFLSLGAAGFFIKNEKYTVVLDAITKFSPLIIFAFVSFVPSLLGITIVRSFERSAINRQIEELRIKREEAELLNKTKQTLETESESDGNQTVNASAAGDFKPDEALSERQSAVQPTPGENKLDDLKERVDVNERANDMRRYIVYDIFTMLLLVLSFLVLAFPFVTILGEKYGVFDLYKSSLKDPKAWLSFNIEENVYSDICIEVFNLKPGIPLEIITVYFALFSTLFPIACCLIMVVSQIIPLIVSCSNAQNNIKNEKMVITTAETSRIKWRGSIDSGIYGWIFIVMPYAILFYGLYKYIGGDMNNELFSVNPLWLIVSVLLFIGSVVIMAVKRASFKGNGQLRKDMIYFKLYRGEAMKYNKKLKKQKKI